MQEETFWTAELQEAVKRAAAAAGFDQCAIAPAPAADASEGQASASRFRTWVDQGRAGEMEYLKRRDAEGGLLRESARRAMPWARSVVVCAFSYHVAEPKSTDPSPPGAGWIARYAWQGTADGKPVDYHDDLLERLRVIEEVLAALSPCQTRCYVDTGPLVERDFAARAGIGWVGKNTCILNQELGSWLLLAVMVTSLDVPQAALAIPAVDRCGSCTRCLDACPTQALIAPREMDASLCIAYLTIEKKGSITEPLREPMGRQVFGCDICQDVCPWNRRAPVVERSDLRTRTDLVNADLQWLASLNAETFRQHFRGSPLERTQLRRLQRNVAIAMGNTGDPQYAPQLEVWAAEEDPVLAEAAQWARARLPDRSASMRADAASSRVEPGVK